MWGRLGMLSVLGARRSSKLVCGACKCQFARPVHAFRWFVAAVVLIALATTAGGLAGYVNENTTTQAAPLWPVVSEWIRAAAEHPLLTVYALAGLALSTSIAIIVALWRGSSERSAAYEHALMRAAPKPAAKIEPPTGHFSS